MAKKVVDRLVTELTAESAKMRTELDKSLRETQEWGQRVGKAVKAAGATIAAVGATGAVGLVELSRRSANSARELENMAFVANATAQEMQVLGVAGKEFNLTQEQISQMLKDVNDRVGEFLENGAGPMADFFDNVGPKVGITADHFKNLSGPQAMQLFISSLEKANLSQDRFTYYMESISGEALALAPLFRDNGAALDEYRQKMEGLNLILSDSEVADLAGLSSKFDQFGATLSVTGDRIALGAVPAIEDLMDLLADERTIENLQSFGRGVVTVFTAGVDVVSKFAEGLQELDSRINGIRSDDIERLTIRLYEVRNQLNDIENDNTGPLDFGGSLIEERLVAERKTLEAQIDAYFDLQDRLKSQSSESGSSEDKDSGGGAPSVDGTLFDPAAAVPELMQNYIADQAKLNELADQYIARSERTVGLMGAETEASKLLYEIESGRFAELTPARKEELTDVATKIDLLNQERATREQLQEQLKEDQATAAELRAMALSEEEAIYQGLRENLTDLSEMVNKGLISGDEGASISATLAKDAEKAAEQVKDKTGEMSVFADEAARNMQGHLGGFFRSMGKDTDQLEDNFKNMLKNMAAEAAAAEFMDLLGLGGGGGGGKAGGFMQIAQMFGGFFADGGRPPMGKVSMVGERGPELFVPDTAGTIVPNGGFGGGIKGVTVINNGEPVSGSASMTEDGELQIVLNAVKNSLREDLSAGRGVWREAKQKFGWSTKGAI